MLENIKLLVFLNCSMLIALFALGASETLFHVHVFFSEWHSLQRVDNSNLFFHYLFLIRQS